MSFIGGEKQGVKIVVLTNSLSRLGGGVFWSVRGLTSGLSERGCDLQVFAAEDRQTEADLSSWDTNAVASLSVRGPAALGYLPGLQSAVNGLNPEILHVHGIWRYDTVVVLQWASRTGKPYVVSPHGCLDAWALSRSAWKKRLAGLLYHREFLRRAACFHALNESEMRSIRALGLSNPVAVIPNGVELPRRCCTTRFPEWAVPLQADIKVLVFLGRLHPKKGLVNLLHGWAQAQRDDKGTSSAWRLAIAGWDQGGHQAVLEGLAHDLGVKDSVLFIGPQFDEAKAATLERADAFVLPSFSEGLPMAVLEAWAYRLPVLMTPQCNLPEGFSVGAALAIEPEPDNICVGLKNLFAMDASALVAMGERGRHLVETRFTWPRVAAEMYAVYQWLLGKAAKPDCVDDERAA